MKYEEIKKINGIISRIAYIGGVPLPLRRGIPKHKKRIETEGKTLIAITLGRIPKKVRENILNHVVFFIVHPSMYGMLSGIKIRSLRKGFIVLNLDAIARDYPKKTERDARAINAIAHEVAHFTLGHHNMPTSVDQYLQNEWDAKNLSKRWGFGMKEENELTESGRIAIL